MKIVNKKLSKKCFHQVISKRRKSEILENNLQCRVGDILQLREVDRYGKYTDKVAITKVTDRLTSKHILGLKRGYCLVSFEMQNIIDIVQG